MLCLLWTVVLLATYILGAGAQCSILHFNDVYDTTNLPALAFLRKKLEPHRSLLFFGGDMLGGSREGVKSQGRHAVALLNALNVDVAVLGNHDFDFGLDILQQRVQESNFSWLSANSSPQLVNVSAWKTVQCGAYKLCVAGLTGQFSNMDPSLGMADPLSILRVMNMSRPRGCKYELALTHMDLQDDIELARRWISLLMILGGHEHTHQHVMQNTVPIFKADMDARTVWILEISEKNIQAGLVSFTSSTSRDKDMAALVAQWQSVRNQTQLTKLTRRLDTRSTVVRTQRMPIGFWLGAIMQGIARADCALFHSGMLRSERVHDKGSVITVSDLEDMLPFEDDIVLLQSMPSATLRKIQENSSLRGSGSFLQGNCGRHSKSITSSTSAVFLRVAVPGFMVSGQEPLFDDLRKLQATRLGSLRNLTQSFLLSHCV